MGVRFLGCLVPLCCHASYVSYIKFNGGFLVTFTCIIITLDLFYINRLLSLLSVFFVDKRVTLYVSAIVSYICCYYSNNSQLCIILGN